MSVFTDGVAVAFDVALSLELTLSGQCVSVTSSTYDPDTGIHTPTGPTDAVQIVQYDFNLNQIDGQSVKQGDTRFIAKTTDLTQQLYSNIVVEGQNWSVKNTVNEPSKSIKIFHCRLQND